MKRKLTPKQRVPSEEAVSIAKVYEHTNEFGSNDQQAAGKLAREILRLAGKGKP